MGSQDMGTSGPVLKQQEALCASVAGKQRSDTEPCPRTAPAGLSSFGLGPCKPGH